jgi:hypothetical protein
MIQSYYLCPDEKTEFIVPSSIMGGEVLQVKLVLLYWGRGK